MAEEATVCHVLEGQLHHLHFGPYETHWSVAHALSAYYREKQQRPTKRRPNASIQLGALRFMGKFTCRYLPESVIKSWGSLGHVVFQEEAGCEIELVYTRDLCNRAFTNREHLELCTSFYPFCSEELVFPNANGISLADPGRTLTLFSNNFNTF